MISGTSLHRSRTNKVLAGICGGMAESFGWNATFLRVLFVVGSIFPILPGFLVYVVLWVILPKEPPQTTPPRTEQSRPK